MSITPPVKRRLGRLGGASAGVLAVGVALAAPSAALAAAPVAIVAPASGQLVRTPTLTVRLRVRPGTTKLRLRLAGRDVTARLGKGGAERVARIPLRSLPRGRMTLAVGARARSGRRSSTSRAVVLGRHAPKLLRDVSVRSQPGGGSARLRLRLGRRPTGFRVTLDGRRVPLLRLPFAGADTVRLTARDGLRFGRNRVTVSALDARSGRWADATRTLRMSRRAPLVAAGRDRHVIAGARVTLSAAGSHPRRATDRLSYRWEIVGEPRRARRRRAARLVGATTAHPRLITQRPGRYRVRLTVGEHPRTPAGGRARGRDAKPVVVASAASIGAAVSDTMTVEAAASAPPYGLPIHTLVPNADGSSRTTIKGVPINPDGSDDYVDTPAGDIAVIVLDRATLAVDSVQNTTVTAYPQAISKLAPGDLAIVAGAAGCCPGVQIDNVAASNGFTMIVSGEDLGNPIAYNAGSALGAGAPGGVSGLLRQAVTPAGDEEFTFVYPDAVDFDTYVSGLANSRSMVIDGQQTQMPQGTGFQYVVLGPNWNVQYSKAVTLDGNATDDQATLAGLANDLEGISDTVPGGILLFQSFGRPKATTTAWAEVGAALQQFGGTPSVFNTLDGSGDYSLVGTNYPGQTNAALRESSTAEASGPLEAPTATSANAPWAGTLRGVLGRGSDGLPVIRSSTSLPTKVSLSSNLTPIPVNPFALTALAEAPPQPWPLSDPAHDDALAWISQQLGPDGANGVPVGLGSPNASDNGGWCYAPSQQDVRAEYCNTNLATSWGSTFTNQLTALTCPSNNADFTAGQCTDVVAQLKKEFAMLPIVDALIKNLETPFQNNQAQTAVAFLNAADQVDDSLQPPVQDATFDPQTLIDGVLGPLQDIDDDSGLVLGLGILNSAVDVGMSLSTDESGNPALATFDSSRAQIGSEAVQRLTTATNAMEQMESLIVSDWTKLSTVADNATTVWSIDGNTLASAGAQIASSMQQWLYKTMIPVAYGQILVAPPAGPSLAGLLAYQCEVPPPPGDNEPETTYPFNDVGGNGPEPASAVFGPTLMTFPDGTAGPPPYLWALGNANGQASFQMPPASLTDPLFKPVASGGIGLYAAPFYTWSWVGNRVQFTDVVGTSGLDHAYSCQ